MKTGNSKFFNSRTMIFAILEVFCFGVFLAGHSNGQDAADSIGASSSRFRVGEKLTYNVSFGKFSNAAYVEMSVVSRGNLDGHEVVELRSRLKMLGFVSAAFFQFDENRTVFADPDTGLPHYVSKMVNYGVEPKETVGNYLKAPTPNFDLLSLMYKAREVNGTGSFTLFENERAYTVTFQPALSEKVKTEAGEFDTVVSVVQSEYLTERGIKELKINFAVSEGHLPVMFRVKMVQEIFTASLADIQLPKAVVEKIPAPLPTPAAATTPKPAPTPAPYVENQPLSPELGFELGETLDYKVSDNGKPIATITLSAKERKMFRSLDALHLTAIITGIEQGNTTFVLGDSIHVQADPETLSPLWSEGRFGGALKYLNQNVTFDNKSGIAAIGSAEKVEVPIGTHTLLSMIYAMRSFNLKPSKDPKSPVNDTRVAVFWESQPYVFVLQPSNPEEIMISGEKTIAQLVTISTSNQTLDKQGLKVWLGADSRVPVRFSFGNFQADLVSPSKILSK